MRDEVVSYRQMCDQEKVQTLQRGMNFRLSPKYSVILMSQRTNAPYLDRICDDGITIEYEGHDIAKRKGISDPKQIDQPRFNPSGSLTQNGRFAKAVEDFRNKMSEPELVRAYEKLFAGIWSDRGFFELIDFRYEATTGSRKVYIFVLRECDFELDSLANNKRMLRLRTRVIPTEVKRLVWVRDGGKCVTCGASDELHFDHDLPYSKGGSSITAENVKLLCARHNLEKSDKII